MTSATNASLRNRKESWKLATTKEYEKASTYEHFSNVLIWHNIVYNVIVVISDLLQWVVFHFLFRYAECSFENEYINSLSILTLSKKFAIFKAWVTIVGSVCFPSLPSVFSSPLWPYNPGYSPINLNYLPFHFCGTSGRDGCRVMRKGVFGHMRTCIVCADAQSDMRDTLSAFL